MGGRSADGAGFRHHWPVASVTFTSQLRRFTETPEVQTAAGFDSAFEINPRLRGYVLDDQLHLRANVAVFIDGVRVRDRESLADALGRDSRVHVLQALSGG